MITGLIRNKFNVTFLALLSLLLLSGCNEKQNTEQLCVSNPALRCDELNLDDGQCRIPRTELIWHRQFVLRDPSDINKIKEFYLTQNYEHCLEVAAQIQPIDQTEIKARRFHALVMAGENMKKLESELREFHTPHSLYFLWSQLNDRKALYEFLQLDSDERVQTADLQYAYATIYIDRDKPQTIKYLEKAIELSRDPDLDKNVLAALATVNQQLGHPHESYAWTIVAKHFGVDVVGMKLLDLLYGIQDENKEKLDDIADDVIDMIQARDYTGYTMEHMIRKAGL